MTELATVGNYEITKRIDDMYAIWGFGFWPDDYLDENPAANEEYLRRTYGWRASGWAVVHVAPCLPTAIDWCGDRTKGVS